MTDLQTRLNRLRKRAGTALYLYGVSWIVVALLTAVTVIGVFDWWVHLDSDGLRLCLGVGLLMGLGALIWRLLIRPMRNRLTDLAIALRIERRYPGFKDSLASTVQFVANHGDPRIGSPELQRTVVTETLADLQSVSLDDVIETRQVRRTTWLAVGICVMAAIVAGFRPAEAALALNRLMFPFSAADWPRENQLQLLDRDLRPIAGRKFRRVRGATFKFYVEDRKGALPEDVTLFLRYGDGELRAEPLRRVTVRDDAGDLHSLCVANILLERGPIRFRVTGGDDDTLPPSRIDVVPPPQIAALNVQLVPPKYARRQDQQLPKGVGHFEALIGTEVRVAARANKPLRVARLRVKERTIPGVRLSRDGRRITAQFRITESGHYTYRFELKDREGFENPNAPGYDVKAVADRVPVVRLVKPAENIRATAGAAVRIEPLVEDDLRIRSVSLKFAFDRDPKGKYRTIELLRPADFDPNAASASQARRDYGRPFIWQLTDVAPGAQIRFFIEATDDFNLDGDGRPGPTAIAHVGKSLTRTMTIVTPADKTADIAGRYNELLEDLTRVERLQRRAHAQVGQLRVQFDKTGELRPIEDLPTLRRVVQDQHDVRHQLVDGDQSIKRRAEASLADVRANRLNASRLTRRLKRIVDELEAIRRTSLNSVIADLRQVETGRNAPADDSPKPAPRSATNARDRRARLIAAETKQAGILRSLRELIGELSEWRDWHNRSGELHELIRDQSSVRAESARLKPLTLGKPLNELTPQQKADLARLAERQRRAAERLGRFQKSLRKFLANLKDPRGNDRTARETLNDAGALIRRRKLVERMRTAAGRIESNRLGEMADVQKRLGDDLQTLLSVLENRGTGDLQTLIKRQKQAEADLEGLQDRQEQLLEQLRKLGGDAQPAKRDRLAKQQNALRTKADELARTLRRLSATRANRSTQRAADGMRRAAKSLRNGALQQARTEQQEALDSLQQARRDLARTRQQTEAQLAAQMMERLAGDVRAILRRQENVINETARLQSLAQQAIKKNTKPWTRGRLITLDTQREEQDRLAGRLREFAKSTADAAILSLALKTTAGEMTAAVKSLRVARSDAAQLESALRHERSAKKQLEQLLKAMTPQHRASTPATPSGEGGDPGAKVAGPHVTAQLKLLKAMQDQLAADTRRFHKRRPPGGKLTPARQTELDRLTERQEQLSDLSRDMMRKLGIKPRSKPLDSQPGAKADPAQLVRDVVRRMRATAEDLRNSKTGKSTQDTQKRISADLEKLIASAAANAGSGNAQTQTGRKENGLPKGGTRKTTGGNAGTKTGKRPKGSDPGVRNPAESRKVMIARRRRLIQEVWGHLPESVKRKLQNMGGETYIPKYKPLISRYFESLAE
ncbi:MAG: hypothetical protein ACE5KM_16880 [Planctomycetaceae bacterium]